MAVAAFKGEVSNRDRKKPRDPFEFYIEEEWCVELMAGVWALDGSTVDPCAGSGTIPRVLHRLVGGEIWAGDVKRHERCSMLDFYADFTSPAWDVGLPVRQFSNVVFNPPYRPAVKFIKKAMGIAGRRVVALLPIKFLCGQKRGDWFNDLGEPTQIAFLSDRPSMPPGALLLAGEVEQKGGVVDYCWILWDKLERHPKPPLWLRRPKKRS